MLRVRIGPLHLSPDEFLMFNLGSLAAGYQASVGPIAKGSAFAILTSAGMGGYGLGIVQAIAIGPSCITAIGTGGIAAVAFLKAVKEDEQCEKEKTE